MDPSDGVEHRTGGRARCRVGSDERDGFGEDESVACRGRGCVEDGPGEGCRARDYGAAKVKDAYECVV
jgi:hypothetical protein